MTKKIIMMLCVTDAVKRLLVLLIKGMSFMVVSPNSMDQLGVKISSCTKHAQSYPNKLHIPSIKTTISLCMHVHEMKLGGGLLCDACGVNWSWFMYQCRDCKFNLCLECFFQARVSLNHPSHAHHSLRLVNKRAYFECDACSKESEQVEVEYYSYMCDECPYWIHKNCANLPTSFVSTSHKHPLTLDYSLPTIYHTYLPFCSICDETLNPKHWLYHCLQCRFFSHIKCARFVILISISNFIALYFTLIILS